MFVALVGFVVLFFLYAVLVGFYIRDYYARKRLGDGLAIPEGESGILIRFGENGGPVGIDFRERPAARVVADLLICANFLSAEIEGAIAKAAGLDGDPSPGMLSSEAQVVGDLLMAAHKLTMEIEGKVANRAQLFPVPPPVEEKVVG